MWPTECFWLVNSEVPVRVALTCCLACLITTGCLVQEGVASEPPVQPCPVVLVQKAPTPPHCVQVDGKDVGMLPLELRLGSRTTIHFAEWTQVDESSSDVIGFAAHLPADVVYAVKAGDDVYTGREPRWLHPAGITGPRVHRIDAVTFCRVLATRCGATPVLVDTSSSSGLGVVASR